MLPRSQATLPLRFSAQIRLLKAKNPQVSAVSQPRVHNPEARQCETPAEPGNERLTALTALPGSLPVPATDMGTGCRLPGVRW
jgi:hypothetical protein